MGPKKMVMLLLAVAMAVLVWRIVIVLHHPASPDRTAVATDTRIDSILWGCILALWRNPALNPSSAQSLASVKYCILALMVLMATFALYSNEFFRETVRYTLESVSLIPRFCAAILKDGWFVVRLLNLKPLRWLGQISYTFYLSHFMFFNLFHGIVPHWPKMLTAVVVLICTLLFCQLVRMTIEVPLGRIRKKHQYARVESERVLQP